MLNRKSAFSFFASSENIIAIVLLIIAAALPANMKPYSVNVYSQYYTSILLGLSITLIWGFTGIFSFGQAAFFGIGGYVYGVICLIMENPALSPLAAVAGIAAAAIAAGIIGFFMFYGGINDVFVGLITLCFTIAASTFMGQTAGEQWAICGVRLNGYNGLNGIPMLTFGTSGMSVSAFYYLCLAAIGVVFFGLRILQRTKIGYALVAIRENRPRAQLLGYVVPKYQTLVFMAGGAIAGLAGVLYAAWGQYINPATMSLDASTLAVVLVAAGGRKSPLAAIVFTFAYSLISSKLSSSGSQYALVILGLILIVVILFVPQGVLATLFEKIDLAVTTAKRRLFGKKAKALRGVRQI